jgi:hypothetical protein
MTPTDGIFSGVTTRKRDLIIDFVNKSFVLLLNKLSGIQVSGAPSRKKVLKRRSMLKCVLSELR